MKSTMKMATYFSLELSYQKWFNHIKSVVVIQNLTTVLLIMVPVCKLLQTQADAKRTKKEITQNPMPFIVIRQIETCQDVFGRNKFQRNIICADDAINVNQVKSRFNATMNSKSWFFLVWHIFTRTVYIVEQLLQCDSLNAQNLNDYCII